MDSQDDTNHDETITQFMSITGAEEEIAKNTLEACNWNVEMAINMYVDSNLPAPARPVARNPIIGPEPLVAQDEPLQSDEIRPPIPPVRQVLVEDYHSGPFNFRRNASFDAFRNFEQETRWQEQHMLEERESTSAAENSRKTFEDLFRPPLDLIFRGNFEMAKFEGQRQNKWLMVNIQNPQEFACQVLNRDVWSNHAVKSILNEHFIFWQSYHNNNEGQKYINFYHVATFPYVSILDPRTGEKMHCWSEIDTMTFCDNITQFLIEHPSPGPKVARVADVASYDDDNDKPMYEESEDMQLKAAIQASLKDIKDSSDSDSTSSSSASSFNDAPSFQLNNAKVSWKDFLGPEDSAKVEIVIRYPDGKRENVIFPSTSKMKALFLFITEKGFTMDDYDLITNFPKKNLGTFDDDATLESAGIHSRDTLYVQMKH